MESCAMKRVCGVYAAVDQYLTFVQKPISLRAGGTLANSNHVELTGDWSFIILHVIYHVASFILVEAGVYQALYFCVRDPSSWNSRLRFGTALVSVVGRGGYWR
jgi:hypothetical protein